MRATPPAFAGGVAVERHLGVGEGLGLRLWAPRRIGTTPGSTRVEWPSRWATAQRLRGFRDAMRAEVGPADATLVRRLATGSVGEAERAARDPLAMPDPLTAVFTTTGFMTQGLLRALGPRRDVAVVGFDDFPLADMLPVPVTVVAGDPDVLGTVAAQTLFARIDGWAGPQTRRMVRPTLIPRGSGEIRPAGLSRSASR